MRKLIFILVPFLMFSCKQAPKGDSAEVGEAQDVAAASETAKNYRVILGSSAVNWIGTKPTGSHNGALSLTEGNISVENGSIVAGDFIIDMNSLVALDMDEENNAKLAGHLKSPDFFDVENNPTAKFEIVSVAGLPENPEEEILFEGATHQVTGNLELKGTTKSVTFPAKVTLNESVVSTEAKFNIDRTDWGVHYGNDKSLGDKFIHPIVQIGLDIQAGTE